MKNRNPSKPAHDMPNMKAIASETKPYTHPSAEYPIAVQAHDTQVFGTQRRETTKRLAK